MSFDSQLIHTCTIERDLTAGEDLLGNALTGQDPQLVYSGNCRLVEKTERVLNSDKNGYTAVTVFKLLIPPGTVVMEKDRVKSVTLEDGTVLTDAFRIRTALNRRNSHVVRFLSIDLERVS
jgi:hypothetical protein